MNSLPGPEGNEHKKTIMRDSNLAPSVTKY